MLFFKQQPFYVWKHFIIGILNLYFTCCLLKQFFSVHVFHLKKSPKMNLKIQKVKRKAWFKTDWFI